MDSQYKEFTNFNAICFEVDGKNYIYDSFSNRIAKVDAVVLDIIDDTFILSRDDILKKYSGKHEAQDLLKALDDITIAQKDRQIFRKFTLPRLSITSGTSTSEKVKDKVTSQLNKIVFNVTEDCNFRCEYCVYSGHYKYRRLHNKSNVFTVEMGKKAIDFFVQNSNRSNDRYISFYGGEPLLNFDFIKKVVEYSNAINAGIKHGITTNGSLLSSEKIRFIVDNNISLAISVDGPQELHDKYRKRQDNKQTFNLVMDKLRFIKTRYPSYYASQVSINAVLSPYEDNSIDLNKFFATDPVFEGLKGGRKISIGVINPAANEFVKKHAYNKYYYQYLSNSFKTFKHHLINSLDLSAIPIAKDLLARFMKVIHFRSTKSLSDYPYYWPNGICIPGMRTLFISADGSFFPCEKIYDYNRMYIGDIHNGFDFSKIAKYIDDYCRVAIEDCKDCWLFRLCGVCYLNLIDYREDTFSINKRRPYCAAQKYIMAAHLKLYVSIREQNEKAFDYLVEEENRSPGYVDQMLQD